MLDVPAELKQSIDQKSGHLGDWEGKTLPRPPGRSSRRPYFVRDVNPDALAANTAPVLSFERKALELKGPKGVYGSAS